jgi:uncharacterized protein
MDLTLQQPGNHLYVRAISDQGIQIVDDWYAGPLIISRRQLISEWAVTGMGCISESTLAPVFELEPEVVLLGTGASQSFLPAELMAVFYRRGVGIEVMTTHAACRTFNVLALEERLVVAAVLPPAA